MIGERIPKVTWIVGKKTEKRPLYSLHTAEEEMAVQNKLGKLLSYYYATNCEKCCGVYPKFYTEQGLTNYGYYVCMVCGKESTHHPMPWQSREAWNNHEYLFKPEPKNGYQFTLDDFIQN